MRIWSDTCWPWKRLWRRLARRFGEDEEEWGLAGLLHDIDLEVIADDIQTHSKRGAEMASKSALAMWFATR